MSKIAPAKLVSQSSHIVHGKIKITEYFFDVPKDYARPDSGTIRLFARGARKHEVPIVPEANKDKDQLPWMCYLQGGPGHSCPLPQSMPFTQTFLDRGYQMLYVDQRGTGLSTPITASTLQMRGENAVQANYLKLYRADNIVRDCEAIRQTLTADFPEEKKKWSTVGQSYGGFCTTTYLSLHPEGLRESFVFGGLPPLSATADEIYRRLYKKVIQRNEDYYRKYPGDVDRVKAIMKYLQRFGDGKIKLPSEGALTRRRFRQIGIGLGMHGGADQIHEIVLRASYEIEAFGHLTRKALAAIEGYLSYDEALIFSILHEPIYAQGKAPNWAAEHVEKEYPEFNLDREGPVYFTGETIYSWMFEDYAELSKVQDVANMVAKDDNWPRLYDEAQLAKNEVPVYAAVYNEDMYVDVDYSLDTARKIKNCKVFSTNVMFHNAVRARDDVIKQLFSLRDDVIE